MLSPGQSRAGRLVVMVGTSDEPTATMIVESAEQPVESFLTLRVSVAVPPLFQRMVTLSLSPPDTIVPPHGPHW
jgi:hypothetical protein